MKNVLNFIKKAVQSTWVYKFIKSIISNPIYLVLVLIIGVLSYNQGIIYYNKYLELYKEANSEKSGEEDKKEGLKFNQIGNNLYTLTGEVREGDCDRIVGDMPTDFAVILESPGGNLSEGSCLAAHLKLRNVVTVVRNTPVMDENGEIIYTPGLVGKELEIDYMENKTVCASACSLMFLGGDKRYLIGDVWLGIHGPGTPDEFLGKMGPRQLEASAYRTASNLLGLLEDLGVQDPEIRKLFIQIPNQTMYWLHPRDFNKKKNLITLATDYNNFWGVSTSDLEGGLK